MKRRVLLCEALIVALDVGRDDFLVTNHLVDELRNFDLAVRTSRLALGLLWEDMLALQLEDSESDEDTAGLSARRKRDVLMVVVFMGLNVCLLLLANFDFVRARANSSGTR